MSPISDRYELDLSTPEIVMDPYRTYARLRANPGIYYRMPASGRPLVVVLSRYADVRSALNDLPFVSSVAGTPGDPQAASGPQRAQLVSIACSLIERLKLRSSFDLISDYAARLGTRELTVNVIGNALLALLTHRDQLGVLRRAPDRVVRALDELLRFDSPVQWLRRRAFREIELPEGGIIRPGETVVLIIGSANRDNEQFVEPNLLNIDRPNAHRHLALGAGVDARPGALQLRMEAEIGIRELIRYLPGLHLGPTPPTWGAAVGRRALKSLPVQV
jgi:cytochrome P450